MNESDRNRLLREVRFLVLAEKDMELVEDAVALLTFRRTRSGDGYARCPRVGAD